MEHKVIHAADIVTGTWSGGTTSQYYIYPEDADKKAGNYAFVVTSATVDLAESTFTYYGGCDRVIMSLAKEYTLIHNEDDVYPLKPFEPHAFTGEEVTKSEGTYKDFNLIMKRDRCCGEMSSMLLAPGSEFYGPKGSAGENRHIWTLFCYTGGFAFCEAGAEPVMVKAGDMLVLDGAPGTVTWRCANSGAEDCRIVLCKVELY